MFFEIYRKVTKDDLYYNFIMPKDRDASSALLRILNKVPEVTIYFWVIKILCTTVGETATDFLNTNLKFGLTGTTVVMGILLAVVLFFQFRLNAVLSFWIAYILTRPLGASIGDYLSQAKNDGGVGLGTVVTSALFLMTILVTVI